MITLAELTPTLDDAAAARAQGLFDAAAGAIAHPLFSPRHYRERYSDVADAGLDPLLHYLRCGASEHRDPHPLFHTEWYVRQCGRVVPPGMTPLTHYLMVGVHLQLDPHPLFSTAHYLRQAPGLAGAGINPLVHYVTGGWRAGLDPHPLFLAAYVADQVSAGSLPGDVSPLERYLLADPASAADPHPLFSARRYREGNPDVAASGVNPLFHFVTLGAWEGRSPHPLFDLRLYRERCGDRLPAGVNPLVHFLEHGEARGISPHELLDGNVFPTAHGAGDRPRAARVPGLLNGVGTAGPVADGWVKALNLMRPLPVPASDPRPPAISVVVRVGETVPTMLALMSLRWHRSRHRHELVLWADGHCRITERILSRLQGARVLARPTGGSGLRQAGRSARGRWVVFHDGIRRVGPGWLDALVAPLERDPLVGLVEQDVAADGAGSSGTGVFAVPRDLLVELADDAGEPGLPAAGVDDLARRVLASGRRVVR